MLSISIPTRAISPHSVRRIINMSGLASSSSVKRKRDHPGDTRPDTKAPKRASEPRTYSQTTRVAPCVGVGSSVQLTYSLLVPQSFQSSKSAEREKKWPTRRIRSPSGGSPLSSVRRAVVYTACTSPRLHLRASRRSISMVPLSSPPMSKSGGGALAAAAAAANNNSAAW
jgi:hypothetical protein